MYDFCFAGENASPHSRPKTGAAMCAMSTASIGGPAPCGRGAIALRQKLSRGQVEVRFANMPPCLIGMEACVGAHHLSRQLLALGHDVKLIPARYVKPFLKGHKNDFRDKVYSGQSMAPRLALRERSKALGHPRTGKARMIDNLLHSIGFVHMRRKKEEGRGAVSSMPLSLGGDRRGPSRLCLHGATQV